MKESDLTSTEIAEFTRWLMAQSGNSAQKEHEDSKVSFAEALQVVSWLKGRMSSIGIGEADRRQLCQWLTAKLSGNSGLTEEELSCVHRQLLDKF